MRYLGFDRTLGQGCVLGFGASSDGSSGSAKPTLSEYILAGNAISAIDYAVEQIVGSPTDWNLDAANSRLSYTNPNPVSDLASSPYGWIVALYGKNPQASGMQEYGGTTPQEACQRAAVLYGLGENPVTEDITAVDATCRSTNYAAVVKTLFVPNNPLYDPDAPPPDNNIYIAVTDIAASIRANADNGHAESQAVVAATT